MTDHAKDLNRLYPYLAVFMIVMGVAVSTKVGWFTGFFGTLMAATMVFAIIFFVQRAITKRGPVTAWRILTVTAPVLVAIWIIKGIMLLLR